MERVLVWSNIGYSLLNSSTHIVKRARAAGELSKLYPISTTLPPPMDRALTTWCAHFSKKGGALMRGELAVECVHANLAGSYDFAIGFGQPWLVATGVSTASGIGRSGRPSCWWSGTTTGSAR